MSNPPKFRCGDLVEIAPGEVNFHDNLDYVQRRFSECYSFVVAPQTRFMIVYVWADANLVRVVPVDITGYPIWPLDRTAPEFCVDRFQHISPTVSVTRRLTVLGK